MPAYAAKRVFHGTLRRRPWLLALAVLAGGGVAAAAVQGPGDEPVASPVDLAMQSIQSALGTVRDMVREWEPIGDDMILRCLRGKEQRLKVLEAAVLAEGARAQAGAAPAADPRCAQYPAFCAPAGDADGEAGDDVVASAPVEADTVAQEARACLRTQSGEVIDYLAFAAALPPDLDDADADAGTDEDLLEPEPVDMPLSVLRDR